MTAVETIMQAEIERLRAQVAKPDCRTCARYRLLGGPWCDYTVTKIKCVNADRYEALPPVRLWRNDAAPPST